MSVITENSTTRVHYTGKLTNNEVFDSSKAIEGKPEFQDRDPLEVTLGKGMLIPGFEKALIGMKVGEQKTVKIPCKEAYGEPSPKNHHEVEREQLPPDVSEGDMLVNNTPNGPITVTVKELAEKTAILDANHPLSGKDLVFELEVVSIEE